MLDPRLTYQGLNLSLKTWTLLQQMIFLSPLPCSPSLRVTNDYIPIPLSPFLALEAETHGDLELQQTCQALHAELQNNLTYNKGPLSSDTVVRHDVSSPSQEEVSLLDVSMPHQPPVSDGKMYADTGWCMSYQNCDLWVRNPITLSHIAKHP